MGGGQPQRIEEPAIVACTVSRDVQNFDLLIDDMEIELGEGWGDLTLDEARAFFDQPEAEDLEFVAIAVDSEDEGDIGLIGDIIRSAKARAIKAILIAENFSAAGMHQLLRLGADDFIPYPMAENALHDAIDRIRRPVPIAAPVAQPTGPAPLNPAPRMDTKGAIFAVQGLAGGVGATTFAINLGWELATIDKKASPSVCVIDFDLQFGTASTYLDLPRRDMIVEMLSDAQSMDIDAFKQALVSHGDKLSVFTAPAEILPLDMISPDDVTAILNLAQQCFDIVLVEMPTTVTQWTETVLNRADVYFVLMELEMRSAQNAMRFIKALQSEDLPLDKVNFVLNRAPGLTDLSGKGRVKKLSESLGVKISTLLPDGGKQVTQSGDHGSTLAESAKKNALRREIAKLAKSLHGAMVVAAEAR